MLASQRRSAILALVEEAGAARVSELVDQLGVSDMTVRRDIERLDAEGLLERVHGGAIALLPRAADEPGFSAKSSLMTAEKHAIALAAAALVEPGATIGISAGTTTYEFARAIRNIPALTVVTNSVPVAQLLHEGSGNHVVVLTGGVRTPSDALVGPAAVSAPGPRPTAPSWVPVARCACWPITPRWGSSASRRSWRWTRSTPSSPTRGCPRARAASSRRASTTCCSPTWPGPT